MTDKIPSVRNEIDYVLGKREVGELDKALSDGRAFMTGNRWSSISDGGTVETTFVNPPSASGTMHVATYNIYTEGKTDVDVFSNSTINTDGTVMDVMNRRIASTKTSSTDIFVDGSYAPGETGPSFFVGSGGNIMNRTGGSQKVDAYEIDPGNNLHIRMINNSGGSIDISFTVTWFED